MATTFELESTLTDRYQTTVPETVRRILQLDKRDKIQYIVQPDGAVQITRATLQDTEDPVLDNFLNFLAHDMAIRPDTLKAIDTSLLNHIQSLIHNVEVDLDAPLSASDE